MKRAGNLVFSILFAVLLTACTSYIEEAGMPVQEPVSKLLRISSTDTVLTSADASIVALMERHGAASTKSSNMDEIDDIVPIYGDEGDVIMYAVNFRTGGYTIVSATKDYYPVLAKIEKGRYSDELYKTGASVLMQEYREGMKYAKTLPRDSILSLRALWMKYEEPHIGQWVATKSDDPLFDLVSDSIWAWTHSGVSFWFLYEGKPNALPDYVYQEYLSLASGYSNPNYDYLNNCVIVGRPSEHSGSIGPLVTTDWGQRWPYNSGLSQDWPIGCGAVAAGQVMAYHKFPVIWDWDNIIAEGDKIGLFLYEVATGINTDFGPDGSESTFNDTKDYLEEIGYNVQQVSHRASYVEGSIRADRPVLMRGDNGEFGHAWICDGLQTHERYVTYSLLLISCSEPLKYEQWGTPYVDHLTAVPTMYHMNWGNNGLGNGFFVEDGWPGSTSIYSNHRQDLIHIYPEN